MLKWTLIFLAVSAISAILGFGNVSSASAGIAKICFYLFLFLFIASGIIHIFKIPFFGL